MKSQTRSTSLRIALLAFALSVWVEGSTQLRRSALLVSAPYHDDFELRDVADEQDGGRSWWQILLSWGKRRGRKLTELERLCFGAFDLSTAFVILHGLRTAPLLPFLISPLLGELAVPSPFATHHTRPKWRNLLLASGSLTVLHSISRILVCSLLKRYVRPQHVLPNGTDIIVKGEELVPSSSLDTNEECLICSQQGPAPLEAFCTTAPKLHPVHRACFMRWRAAYANQRPPELIDLCGEGDVATEAERRRAVAMLQAASSTPFSPLLRLITSGADPLPSVLSLLPSPPLPLPVGPSQLPLAKLKTTSPPCPACRSSVLLHFMLSIAATGEDGCSLSRREVIIDHIREWGRLVTGRTMVAQFIAQQGFVLALMSMMQAQGVQLFVGTNGIIA